IVSPLNQIRFLYGFNSNSTKTLSTDLLSIQFKPGLKATFGQSVTMGPSTTSTSTTTITDSSGTQKQTTSTLTTDTPQTAIAKLESGGDLFVRLDYPLLYHNKKDDKFAWMVFGSGTEAGNFSGLGSEGTITQANEYNFNASTEWYAEWRAINNDGM